MKFPTPSLASGLASGLAPGGHRHASGLRPRPSFLGWLRASGATLLLGGLMSGLLGGTAQAAATPCGMFGITINSVGDLLALEQKTACTFMSVRWFQDWQPFNQTYARRLVSLGRSPEVSWQPRQVNSRGQLVGIPYREIASGKHDAYLKNFARSVGKVGKPVSITFAPEMNGDWGAYQLGPKNTPKEFVQAWRHMHDIFKRERAPVRWVWSPNILYPGSMSSYKELYPGDAYVDEVGLDGYNWGTLKSYMRWKSFEEVFAPSYLALKKLTNKPIQLGEFSSVEQGGSKAKWIAGACVTLKDYSRIKKAFWFNMYDTANKADWRLTTSVTAVEAFKKCVRQQAQASKSG